MNFLLHTCGNLACEDTLAVLGTPDEVISELVGDVFGMLCFHPRQITFVLALRQPVFGPAYPYLKVRGKPALPSSNESSGRGSGRRGTGEDWIRLVVVEPNKRKQSRSRSS
jgi:hypothetical protein